MKILILNHSDGTTLGDSYARAFRHLGHEVTHVDPAARLQEWWLWRNRVVRRGCEYLLLALFNRQLLATIAPHACDVCWVGKGDWALPNFWRQFRRIRPDTKLICYNPDNPIHSYSRGGNRLWVTASIPLFDFYCTYNRGLLQSLSAAGARQVMHLPFGWDPELHNASAAIDKQHDIVFIGNWDQHREEWLTPIAAAATSNSWRFQVYGEPQSWRRCRNWVLLRYYAGKPLYGHDMAEMTASTAVSLNILRLQNSDSHNMRTFEIPGCGGCMLSQFTKEQNEFFPDKQAAVYCETPRAAVERIAELLSNGEQRTKIRCTAGEIVVRHTYLDRAKSLFHYVQSAK